jgi:hypothetical protein
MAVKRISRQLNLVILLERDEDEIPVWVHSTPISTDVFDTYYKVIAKTFATIYNQGLGVIAGARVASKVLKEVSEELKIWESVQQGLVLEIERLTNVLIPGERGWETIPYPEAKQREIIHPEDAAEVDNAITFFTVASVMHRKSELKSLLSGGMALWGARVESSSFTDFRNSLPMWKRPDNTGEMPTTSSPKS